MESIPVLHEPEMVISVLNICQSSSIPFRRKTVFPAPAPPTTREQKVSRGAEHGTGMKAIDTMMPFTGDQEVPEEEPQIPKEGVPIVRALPFIPR